MAVCVIAHLILHRHLSFHFSFNFPHTSTTFKLLEIGCCWLAGFPSYSSFVLYASLTHLFSSLHHTGRILLKRPFSHSQEHPSTPIPTRICPNIFPNHSRPSASSQRCIAWWCWYRSSSTHWTRSWRACARQPDILPLDMDRGSGGQLQRLSITRARLRNLTVLILSMFPWFGFHPWNLTDEVPQTRQLQP